MATMRERFRADVRAQIVEAAHAQMVDAGANAISLRAVARTLAMAPSAVHRYFATRDDVVTALMIREYESLGAAMTAADGAVRPRSDCAGRASAVFTAHREWALAYPHSWSLLFGSPVPGYAEPRDVCEAANRFVTLMVAIVADAHRGPAPPPLQPPASAWPAAGDALIAAAPSGMIPQMPAWQVATGLAAYAWMVGAITAEQRGFFVDFVADSQALYEAGVRRWVAALGLAPDGPLARTTP